MEKFNYDKSKLKGLKMNDFFELKKERKAHIEASPTGVPNSMFNANVLAKTINPPYLLGKIKVVNPFPMGVMYIIEPYAEGGFTEFPPFHAGQYLSFKIDMGDKYACRDYCISCSPKSTLGSENNTYTVVVMKVPGPGHVCEYIHQTWQVGTVVKFSAPQGKNYYDPLRDAKNVVMIGMGGVGLPHAMSITDGIDDYNLTVLFTVLKPMMLANRPAYEAMAARSNGKIKYVPIVTEDCPPDCVQGPINPGIVKRYTTNPETGEPIDTTFILVGPGPVVDGLSMMLKGMGIPKRRIRVEYQSEYYKIGKEPNYPADTIDKVFNVKVWVHGEEYNIKCPANESLANAVQKANIHLNTVCRSGECGMCRSRLIKGEYYMPKDRDFRRAADLKFGWIHPCCTYPLSDMEIEVFPMN